MTGRIASWAPHGAFLGLVRSRMTAKIATISSVGVPRRKRKSSPHRSCMSSMGSNRTWGREPQCGGSPCGSQITASATARAASTKRRRKRRGVMSCGCSHGVGGSWSRPRLGWPTHWARPAGLWHGDGTPRRKRIAGHGMGRVVDPAWPAAFVVEPPAGIEPATPSLPWNHQEPLCEPLFPQVGPDRRGRSYRFSFDQGMRSPSGHAPIVAEPSHHPTSHHCAHPWSVNRQDRPCARPSDQPGGWLQAWAQCWARSWSSARSSASTLARISRSSWPAATSTA